jgi:hypothetical protein
MLVKQRGFPPPIDGFQRRLWPRSLVLNWIEKRDAAPGPDLIRPRNVMRAQAGLPPE